MCCQPISVCGSGSAVFLAVRILRVLRVFRVLRMVRYVGEAELIAHIGGQSTQNHCVCGVGAGADGDIWRLDVRGGGRYQSGFCQHSAQYLLGRDHDDHGWLRRHNAEHAARSVAGILHHDYGLRHYRRTDGYRDVRIE